MPYQAKSWLEMLENKGEKPQNAMKLKEKR